MNFLWPQAWFLAALAVPVVLLYLIRTRPKQRTVSTLLFWEAVSPPLRSSPLWRKLRRLISLLLQLLFSVAHLRPRPAPAPLAGAEPQSVVFVIDTHPRWPPRPGNRPPWPSPGKSFAHASGHCAPDDQVLLMASGEPPRIVRPLDRQPAHPPGGRRLARASARPARLARGPRTGRPPSPPNRKRQNRPHFRRRGRRAIGKPTTAPIESSRSKSPEPEHGLTHFSARRSRLDAREVLIHARLARSQPGDRPSNRPGPASWNSGSTTASRMWFHSANPSRTQPPTPGALTLPDCGHPRSAAPLRHPDPLATDDTADRSRSIRRRSSRSSWSDPPTLSSQRSYPPSTRFANASHPNRGDPRGTPCSSSTRPLRQRTSARGRSS